MALSAVYLAMNAFLMTLLVFLSHSDKQMSLMEVIKLYFQKGASLSQNNDGDEAKLEDLIEKEKKDKEYKPT